MDVKAEKGGTLKKIRLSLNPNILFQKNKIDDDDIDWVYSMW